jgi:hypothetical protein
MSAPRDERDEPPRAGPLGTALAPGPTRLELLAPLGGVPGREVRLCRRVGVTGDGALFAFRPLADLALTHAGARAAIARRVEVARHLRYPGWVDIVGTDVADGVPGLLMELVAGMDLSAMTARGPLSLQMVAHIGARIAGALDALHRGRDLLDRPRKLVHGSVTPDKVLLSFTGDVKLLDFGVTRASPRALGGVEAWPAVLAPWSPPECLEGAPPSVESDLYMLGTTLYLMLTGRAPFAPGERPSPARLNHLAPPSRVRDEVRASLDALVMGLLDRDPSRRPADALEVREALDGVSVRRALASRVRDLAGDRHAALAEVLTAPDGSRSEGGAVLLVPPEPPVLEAPRGPPTPLDLEASIEASAALVRTSPAPLAHRRPEGIVAPALRAQPSLTPAALAQAPAPALDPADSLERIASEVHQLWAGPKPSSFAAQRQLPAPQFLALPAPAESSDAVASSPPVKPTLGRKWAVPPLLAALCLLIWVWPRGPGVLEVRAQPTTARITVDGEAVSTAQATFSLPPGVHEVQILADGYRPVRVQEDLQSGQRRILAVSLARDSEAKGADERSLAEGGGTAPAARDPRDPAAPTPSVDPAMAPSASEPLSAPEPAPAPPAAPAAPGGAATPVSAPEVTATPLAPPSDPAPAPAAPEVSPLAPARAPEVAPAAPPSPRPATPPPAQGAAEDEPL